MREVKVYQTLGLRLNLGELEETKGKKLIAGTVDPSVLKK